MTDSLEKSKAIAMIEIVDSRCTHDINIAKPKASLVRRTTTSSAPSETIVPQLPTVTRSSSIGCAIQPTATNSPSNRRHHQHPHAWINFLSSSSSSQVLSTPSSASLVSHFDALDSPPSRRRLSKSTSTPSSTSRTTTSFYQLQQTCEDEYDCRRIASSDDAIGECDVSCRDTCNTCTVERVNDPLINEQLKWNSVSKIQQRCMLGDLTKERKSVSETSPTSKTCSASSSSAVTESSIVACEYDDLLHIPPHEKNHSPPPLPLNVMYRTMKGEQKNSFSKSKTENEKILLDVSSNKTDHRFYYSGNDGPTFRYASDEDDPQGSVEINPYRRRCTSIPLSLLHGSDDDDNISHITVDETTTSTSRIDSWISHPWWNMTEYGELQLDRNDDDNNRSSAIDCEDEETSINQNEDYRPDKNVCDADEDCHKNPTDQTNFESSCNLLFVLQNRMSSSFSFQNNSSAVTHDARWGITTTTIDDC